MRRVPVVAALLVVVSGIFFQVRGDSFALGTAVLPVTWLNKSGPEKDTQLPGANGLRAGKLQDSPRLLAQASTTPLRKHHRVVLSWTPSDTSLTGGDVIGYNVYRCSGLTTKFAKLNAEPVVTPEYVDDQVRSGGVYYYATTAINEAGKQSRHSNLVRVVIPEP